MFEEYVIKEFKGVNQWLSNMQVMTPFIIDGISYNAVENYYQGQKTTAIGRRLQISKMNPYDSKSWGKAVTLREDWSKIKDDVMKQALEIKFSQPRFYNLLINTGVKELIEGNYHGDTYWGVCLKTNKGKNKLGQFITEIRTRIFEELDNTEMLIDNYANIRRELDKFDYKHMDKAVIRFMQNEFVKTFEIEGLELINKLFEDQDLEMILEYVNSDVYQSSDMKEKLQYSMIYSALSGFVEKYQIYFKQSQLTVNIK